MLHQKISALMFVAMTHRVALIKCEGTIIRLLSPSLLNDCIILIDLSFISWIDQIVIVFIASTLFGILATIGTFTKCSPFLGTQVLLYGHQFNKVLI
jgi:hypothetical protein